MPAVPTVGQTTATAHPAVPALDLTSYTDGGSDAEARARAAANLDAACRGGSGFFAARLPMGAVDDALVARAFAAAKELFELPEAVKMDTMRRLTAESNCGYSPLSVEALDRERGPDCKEAFNVRKAGVHNNDYRCWCTIWKSIRAHCG